MSTSESAPGRMDTRLRDLRDPIDPLRVGEELVPRLRDVVLDAALGGGDALRTGGEVDLAPRYDSGQKRQSVIRVKIVFDASLSASVEDDSASWGRAHQLRIEGNRVQTTHIRGPDR